MQVAAMDHPVGRAEAADGIRAQIEQLPAFAGVPEPDLLARRLAHHGFECCAQPQLDQEAGAVRRDLDARAKLAQLLGLLEDPHPKAPAQKCQGRGEPADPASGDEDVLFGVQGWRSFLWSKPGHRCSLPLFSMREGNSIWSKRLPSANA